MYARQQVYITVKRPLEGSNPVFMIFIDDHYALTAQVRFCVVIAVTLPNTILSVNVSVPLEGTMLF